MLSLALLLACTRPPAEDTLPAARIPDGSISPPPSAGGDGAKLLINEFQADNESTWQNPDDWSFPDWVEIVNAGTEPADLQDIALTDSSGTSWRGPSSGFLSPGEIAFLATSGVDSDFELPFFLDSSGTETLVLSYRGTLVDVAPVGVLGNDLSMARFPDGGAWLPTARPTPDTSNGSHPSETLDPTSELLQEFVMHEMSVRVDKSLYGQIDARTPTPCELTIDGVFFRKVDVKSGGEASYDTIANGKPRLTFNLDAYETTRTFRGVDNIELHNGKVADSTRGRDWVSYKLARLGGAPAARVGFTHLVINNDDYGLYVMIENPDDKFIEARFPASARTGMIFEGGDFGGNLGGMDYEHGPVHAPEASAAAMEAADKIVSGPSTDEAVAKLWNYVDKDEILNFIAFEGIANNWDGYDAPHNYRWYVDGVDHMSRLVPSGIEITWTGDPELWTSGGNLAEFCIDNPGCKRELGQHIIDMANIVDDEDLAGQYDAVTTWLRPYIKADPRKFVENWRVPIHTQFALNHLENNPEKAREGVYALYPDLRP